MNSEKEPGQSRPALARERRANKARRARRALSREQRGKGKATLNVVAQLRMRTRRKGRTVAPSAAGSPFNHEQRKHHNAPNDAASASLGQRLMMQCKRLLRVVLNPRLLLCLAIAWMITNGWSYVLFAVGLLWKISWMRAVGGAYMGFLWLPFTPEKLATLALAILLLRVLYPKDKATLGTLRATLARFRRKRGRSEP